MKEEYGVKSEGSPKGSAKTGGVEVRESAQESERGGRAHQEVAPSTAHMGE